MGAELRFAAILCAACLAGFVLLFRLTERGRTGAALTALSLLGAGAVVGWYLAARIGPPQAEQAAFFSVALCAPALLGGIAGGALGRAIDSRRDRASLRGNRYD